EVRDVAVGHGKLMSRREPLEDCHGIAPDLHRLLRPADVTQQSRKRAERISFATLIAGLPVTLDRALLRVDRLVELADRVARVRASVEQLSPRVEAQSVRESQRPRVLRGGLATCAEGGRARGSCGRKLEHRVRVPGRLSMMREPGEVRSAVGRVLERTERLAVQFELAVRWERLLDRKAGELVP